MDASEAAPYKLVSSTDALISLIYADLQLTDQFAIESTRLWQRQEYANDAMAMNYDD